MADYCVLYRCYLATCPDYLFTEARSKSTISKRLHLFGVSSGYEIQTIHISDLGRKREIVKIENF